MDTNLDYWKYLDFNSLIEHGIKNGANIVNGMPWSWKINGKAVTHERDDLLVLAIPSPLYAMKGMSIFNF